MTEEDKLYADELKNRALADYERLDLAINELERQFSYSGDDIFEAIEKFTRLQREYKEQVLAEIITKYDFIVGSKECKLKLMEILPEGANIICSPYIESPTTIYAIKKFDAMDLIMGTRTESEEEG